MKYSILVLSLIGLCFFSCKDDEDICKTCELADPLFGLTISTEFCQKGDDVLMTVTALGISSDSTIMNATVANLVSAQELTGATCD